MDSVAGEARVQAARIISTCIVKPAATRKDRERVFHQLTPWDLKLIVMGYIQKGLLLPKPSNDRESMVSYLKNSLSIALDHFFPLAGRLAVTNHSNNDESRPSISFSIDCNDQGAEFVHASAPDVAVSDILTPLYVPKVVESFFPLNGALNLDATKIPILAVQVTELADGTFIGCSMNHAAADGVSFWNFMNAWSEISRTSNPEISCPPLTDRWFLDCCAPPIRLPVSDPFHLVKTLSISPILNDCVFHFSTESVAKLKEKANNEMGTNCTISSLQSLLAHAWRAVTRARNLKATETTGYSLAIGDRTRLDPPLPPTYLGNSLQISNPVEITAGELLSKDIGFAASKLHQVIASHTDAMIKKWLQSWIESPKLTYLGRFTPRNLLTGSSPRFDVYGNDFGWGQPMAVRSGAANKFDGKVTVYPGPESGSMALEICLPPETLGRLIEDKEFMVVVNCRT